MIERRTLLFAGASPFVGCATKRESEPQPIVELTTDEDHRRMLALLGVSSLRPGRNGLDPNAPNYPHYDEARANPYPTLPDPLVARSGRRVTSATTWRRVRRPELIEDFSREVYGREPARTPRVHWRTSEAHSEIVGPHRAVTRRLTGHVDNAAYPLIGVDIEMSVTLPADAASRVPLILNLSWITPPANFRLPPEPSPTWREQILGRGWGYAILVPGSVQADNGAGLTRGIIGLCNRGQPRDLDDWGALRAWAWGASRALDWFESEPAIDARRIGIQGHSRYGKAALVAMAYDERFAIGFISSSGQGGAKLHRRDYGEIVENLASSGEYHWMAGNYMKYAGPLTWNDLPVDAHELIALVAPRPVFISSGAFEGDAWVDARGMFMAAAAAGPVYRLLGARDLGTNAFPPIETALTDGDIAFRQHSGGHTPGPNWPTFLQFAERYIGANSVL
jgi:hypothetical protein